MQVLILRRENLCLLGDWQQNDSKLQYIKLMISLKIQHKHHLPCHPTRCFLEKQSIHETDRQDISEQSSQDNPQFKTVQSRAVNPYFQSSHLQNPDADTQSKDSEQLLKKKKKRKSQNQKMLDSSGKIYHTDVLDQAFIQSGVSLTKNVRALIMQKQKLIEDKVYLGVIKSAEGAANTILERIYEVDTGSSNIKGYVRQNLLELMGSIQKNITQDINDQKYFVHKIIRSTKNDILNNRKGRLNLNYSTNFSSENCIPEQNDNMTTNSQPVSQDFTLNSEQTKKAEHFIKKIQKQQLQQRAKRREEEEKKKNLEIRSAEEKRQFQQEIKQERKNYLKRRFEAKKQIREKELQVRQKMNKQYKQFLAKYKKKTPLFKKKEEEYEKYKSIEQQKMRQLILQRRKEELRPVRYEQLKEHEKRYYSLKNQKENQKQNQKKLRQEEMNSLSKLSYPKSKYYHILHEQEEKQRERALKEDPKLVRSQLIKKRDEYSKSVRSNYLPKASPQKHKEFQKMLDNLKWSEQLKKNKISDRQHIVEGDKNLQDLHKLMAELREQGRLNQIKTISHQTPPTLKPNYKNYLEELRSQSKPKTPKKRSLSIDYDNNQTIDFSSLKEMAIRKQTQANRRYVYAQSSRDIQKNFKQMNKADDDYLESVKAKVALLNQLS